MFDFYGTVVDMQGSLTRAITPYLEGKGYTENPPGRLVTWWRRTHFENSMIDALLHRDHTPYRQIGFEAVDYTLERAGIEHTDDEVHAGERDHPTRPVPGRRQGADRHEESRAQALHPL